MLRAALWGRCKVHFSQFGEEGVIHRQFPRGFVGTYLDIGAFDPFRFSNTARLWLMGWNGVNVDANRLSIDRFRRHRPGDMNIWGAVVPSSSWSEGATVAFTGSRTSVDPVGQVVAGSESLAPAGAERVPALTLDQIADRVDRPVDFMNLDIEGLDETIVREAAFERLLPGVLAIEQSGEDVSEILRRPSTQRLSDLGYVMIGRICMTSVFRRGGANAVPTGDASEPV